LHGRKPPHFAAAISILMDPRFGQLFNAFARACERLVFPQSGNGSARAKLFSLAAGQDGSVETMKPPPNTRA